IVLNEIDAHPEQVQGIDNKELEGVIEAAMDNGYSLSSAANEDAAADIDTEGGGAGSKTPETKPAQPAPPKVKAYQRKLKKLPAYMQRPTPETQELINVENFRLFVKHVMLMKMQIEQGGIYSVPAYALVNMPGDYGYVIEETNKENDGFEFRYFDPARENNVELTEHLDLFGALFMEQFNKNSNV
ncbi:MAG: hypothetical protein IJR61_00065, partial [Clostridia bacterium]|nr:hypothetical protein [Clostridia bacterium]